MTIRSDYRDNGVILWHSGVVTGEELIAVNQAIYQHVFNDGLSFQLMDLSEVETFAVTQEHMRILAQMDKSHINTQKQYACVVAATDLLFAMSRSWNQQSESDNFETNVVRTMAEALAWFAQKGINVII